MIKWKVHAAESVKELEEVLDQIEKNPTATVHSILDSKRFYVVVYREFIE